MNMLPNKLVKLRKHYGYSQDYVASFLGIDVYKYMNYENGGEMIGYNLCRKLAALYNVEIIEIFKNSDDIELKEVSSNTTDELNIEYFTKKKPFLKRHPLVIAVIVGILLGIGIHVLLNDVLFNKDVSLNIADINRLSASSTTVVYIDDKGAVKGSGSNTNSQISNLVSADAVSVKEGSDFTLVLKNDGTVSSYGFGSKNEEELNKWEGIVEIAAGENHVVGLDKNGKVYCTGDNSDNQCELKQFKNIVRIFAVENGTVGVDEDNNIVYTSGINGVSKLMKAQGLKDIDSSNGNLIWLEDDGTVGYYAVNDSAVFYKTDKWSDITDVACGDDFFAGLKSDGTVVIVIDNDKLSEEVSSWTGIKAIAAGDNYLVAYDGNSIYGVGNNVYGQFAKEDEELETLSAVSGISTDIREDGVVLSFDGVANATNYEITLLNNGNVIDEKKTANTSTIFDSDLFENDNEYEFSIVALGNDNYLSSKAQSHTFVYELSEEDEGEEDNKIEIKSGLKGMARSDFESYLNELEIASRNASVDPASPCDAQIETVTEFDGITEGRSYSRSALERTTVNYKYCKLVSETVTAEEGTNDGQ